MTSILSVDEQYYRSIPWCKALLDDGARYWTTITHQQQASLSSRPGSPSNKIFWETFNSNETMRHFLCQTTQAYKAEQEHARGASYSSHSRPSEAANSGNDTIAAPTTATDTAVRFFVSLADGLDGWRGTCHGGVTATLLDEAMSTVIAVHRSSQRQKAPGQEQEVTAELTVRYLKPVLTGSVVVVRAWIESQVGRKFFAEADVRDHDGVILSTGRAVFVLVKREPTGKL